MSRNRPFQYIVYTNRPAYPEGGCSVGVRKIPRGKTYQDMLDYLPATVGRLKVVRAYSAQVAREYAASVGVRCNGR